MQIHTDNRQIQRDTRQTKIDTTDAGVFFLYNMHRQTKDTNQLDIFVFNETTTIKTFLLVILWSAFT